MHPPQQRDEPPRRATTGDDGHLQGAHGPGPTILIAENEATNRHLMEHILGFAGYRSLSAANGREALDLLDAAPVDLALIDLSMPVLDGFHTIERIRALPERARLPVIAVTAHAHPADRAAALRAGFTDYLTKPFRPRDLLRVVERHLHGA